MSVKLVGQTARHLTTRISEHKTKKGPVKEHFFLNCDTEVTFESIDMLASSSLGENTLLTLGALYIKDIGPSLNMFLFFYLNLFPSCGVFI